MNDASDIVRRKDEHLDIALRSSQDHGRPNPFDAYAFEHCALPELRLDDVDIGAAFLGRRLALPFLISSMTGGPHRGEVINHNLAVAAEALNIPFAVGSQRVALEGGAAAGIDRSLRRAAPSIPIWANIGAAQLVLGYGLDEARRALDMIEADALIIHLNPLQEALQPAGDRDWRGVLDAIAALVAGLPLPVVVKEVGAGVSPEVAERLASAGVAAVDVAGAGGTSWARIEAERTTNAEDHAIAEPFADWGIPTPAALAAVRARCPGLPLIGSGGVRNGVDAAKAIRLGADLVGQAGPVLAAALVSPDMVIRHFHVLAEQLRIACFCAGARDLAALKTARLATDAPALHYL